VVEESDGDLMGDSVNIAARSKLPPSRGSSLFAKTIATATLAQVILDGFFARTALDDLPRETRRTRCGNIAALRFWRESSLIIPVWPGKGGACCKVGATVNLDSPCARRRERSAGRNEETGFQIEQRN
jgi:hypothetical protein